MNYEINDRLARTMGMTVAEVLPDGIVTRTETKPEFCNAYGFAHGGFVYSVGHISAVLSARLCLGRKCIVADASNQYLSSLRVSPAICETQLLRAGKSTLTYRVTVFDGKHRPCFKQTVTLRETHAPEVEVTGKQPALFHNSFDTPRDEVTGLSYPRLSPFFATTCHCYMAGRGERGMKYAVDLLDDVYNVYGYAHGGAIYTCCDAAAGGSMAVLLQKKPVTVSSAITYLCPAAEGPLTVEAKLTRDGNRLVFYDMDITQPDGTLVAVAQFTMQEVEYQATALQKDYQNNAFKK